MECYICRGRLSLRECGKRFCPLYQEHRWLNVKALEKEQYDGSAPGVFVGRFGYPKINVGFLSLPEIKDDAWLYDAPQAWARTRWNVNDITAVRNALINARFKSEVKISKIGTKQGKMLESAQGTAMASKPVNAEIKLAKKPRQITGDGISAPILRASEIKGICLAENPRVHPLVEKAVGDTDLKAQPAVEWLYHKGIDENQITRLLSVGTLGVKRKLVPTRWGITAVDDIIGKRLIEEVKKFPAADCSIFFSSYLGNNYFVMLFPNSWGFELFEGHLPNSWMNPHDEWRFTHDYEFYDGRNDYAEECAGGYYACRLAVLEVLKRMKRQACVVVVRLISSEYSVPLGVWVCREAARKAMNSKQMVFDSREELLKYVRKYCQHSFGVNVSYVFKKSVMLGQRRLGEF